MTSTADRACCTSVTDCVYDNQCYADNALADIDSDGEVEACVDGHWEAEVCLSDGDNSCDQDSDCCSDHCIPAIYNYYDSYSSSLNYVCAPDTTYCGSSIAPFYFASGTVYSSPLAGEDVLLCLEGENYRCFMPSDWCNLGQGVRSTTDDLNGYKCMCATEVIGSCSWRDTPIGEMDSLENCCDGMDNNCNGLLDSEEPGCPAEESEAALAGSCSDGRDNDCDGLVDCDDDGCNCCQKNDCETYSQTQCEACPDECNWANGRCCEDGEFWDPSADDGAGACIQWLPCSPICWIDFCVDNTIACCDGGDGFTYQEQVSAWQP